MAGARIAILSILSNRGWLKSFLTEVRGLLCDLAEPLEVRIQVPASDSKSRALKC